MPGSAIVTLREVYTEKESDKSMHQQTRLTKFCGSGKLSELTDENG